MLKYRIFTFVFLLGWFSDSHAQLVTKKDYSAAFAFQIGAGTAITPASAPGAVSIKPIAGLKITFPFNREWFLGSEINYNSLKTTNRVPNAPEAEKQIKIQLDLQQITVPLYLKYILRSNKSYLLLGGYVSYLYDRKYSLSGFTTSPEASPVHIHPWDGGIIFGFEQRLIKHLHLSLKISSSVKSVLETPLTDKKFIPVQAGLTVSYDLFRLGDCGCD